MPGCERPCNESNTLHLNSFSMVTLVRVSAGLDDWICCSSLSVGCALANALNSTVAKVE